MKVMDYSARLVFARITQQIVVSLAQNLYDIQQRCDLKHKRYKTQMLSSSYSYAHTCKPCKVGCFCCKALTSWIQYCAPHTVGLSVDPNQSKKQCLDHFD